MNDDCRIYLMKINAILLAAGLSTRMKGPNKLLLPLKGDNLISRTYNALMNAELTSIVIVSGRDADKVGASLGLREQDRMVYNDNFQQGMTSSIQAGLKELTNNDAVMIALGDMPWLKPEDYNQLVVHFQKNGGTNKILVPWYGDKRGNPVIFGSEFFDIIMAHSEPNGCAEVVRENRDHVLNLNVTTDRFIMDIDTLEDLERGPSNA